MHNALGPGTHLGYCTNVHAGASYEQMLVNLQRHAVAVKQRVSPDAPMGIGLWLSNQAAQQIIAGRRTAELRDWLEDRGLYVFTLNGFPFGDFHDDVVKHRVYQPDWTQPMRYQYTLALARILAELLPEEGEGSISTLPLGWRSRFESRPGAVEAAARQLTDLVHHLARIELDTGRFIHIDLEPEPGCALETSEDVVRFFEDHLLGSSDDPSVRAYLRVCHDVCHAAVMFESQRDALERYRAAGVTVGKVQLSSAIDVDFERADDEDAARAIRGELEPFAEPRYLHQTLTRNPSGEIAFHDDLADALAGEALRGRWRTHFHVPIHLERIGRLDTTRCDVAAALPKALEDGVRHFELETYAWDVLPEALRPAELADGLAAELRWVRRQVPAEAQP